MKLYRTSKKIIYINRLMGGINMLEIEKEAENAIQWIREFVEKTGAKGIVIGNSGGKDSATVLAMAIKAIGREKVVAVSMPCYSNQNDIEDAKLVAETFDVRFLIVELTNCYEQMEKEIQLEINKMQIEKLSKEATINIKPRLRMTTLYGIAQTLGYLVIGTGNLCEAMVGYTTKWGDSACDFNPIANFTVEEVLKIGEYLGVPKKILEKAPNDGLGGQTDEEKMGITYHQIAEMIELGDIEDKVAKAEILKRFHNSKHKRETIPVYTFQRKNCLLL